MITRVACRVTVEAEGGTGAGLAAWHSCSAGRLLAAPGMGVTKGRARVSPTAETISPDDEGYYSHSYGQLAIHKEMLQVCTVLMKVGFMYFSLEMNDIIT